MTLLYALLLMLLFLVFFVAEFFLPSAGLLGVAAAVSIIAAVAVAFTHSATAGVVFLIAALLLVPAAFAAMVRIWPRTFIGRRILNLEPRSHRGDPAEVRDEGPAGQLAALVGRVGVARTDLLPSGLIEVDGRRWDAVSTGVAIDRGEHVEVVHVHGGRIRVQPTQRPLQTDAAAEQASTNQPPTLETPVESLGIDDSLDV